MSQLNDYYNNNGGGGYVAGGASPFSSTNGSPSGGGFSQKSDASQSIRPMTVAQLVKATQAHTDAEWRVGDAEIGHVSIIGQVTFIQKQVTNCVYSIDDGTGVIEARHWVESNEEDAGKWGHVEEHAMVRVTGSLKSLGAKRYVNASQIRVLTDPHEIFFHCLEVIAVGVIFERGAPPGPGIAQQGLPAAGNSSASSAYVAPAHNVNVNDQYSHFPPIERDIIRFILNQPSNDSGVHVAAIARAIGGNAELISNALEKLMDDGHVFTTIDDSHFQVSQ